MTSMLIFDLGFSSLNIIFEELTVVVLVVIYQSVTPVLSCTLRYCENDALFFNHFSRHFNVVSRLGRNENKIIIGRQYENTRNKVTASFKNRTLTLF